jgi:hypothetical protein
MAQPMRTFGKYSPTLAGMAGAMYLPGAAADARVWMGLVMLPPAMDTNTIVLVHSVISYPLKFSESLGEMALSTSGEWVVHAQRAGASRAASPKALGFP